MTAAIQKVSMEKAVTKLLLNPGCAHMLLQADISLIPITETDCLAVSRCHCTLT